MTVFVTGISGLLGTNLVLLLLQKGYHVKGLVRHRSSYKPGAHERLQLISGELTDDISMYLKDVDIIIHVAAVTQQNLIRYKDYYQVNYTATEKLLACAIEAGVKRFIYVSTANTIGFGIEPGNDKPEERLMAAPFTQSFYARSKAAAERYILRRQKEIEVCIVNPTFMIGPHDSKPSSGKIILMGLKRRVLFYPPGGKNFVSVTSVAAAIERCIHAGKNGERYLLADANMTYRAFFKMLKGQTKKRQLLLPVPVFILRLAGHVGDALRFFKIKTSLCTNNMKILCVKNYYDNRTSVTELGAQYQSIEKAVAESIAYFNGKGTTNAENARVDATSA